MDEIQIPQPKTNKLKQLHDVSISNPLDGQVLQYDDGEGRWKAVTLPEPVIPEIPDPPPPHTTYEVRLSTDAAMTISVADVAGMGLTVADAGTYLLQINVTVNVPVSPSGRCDLYLSRTGSVTTQTQFGQVETNVIARPVVPYSSVVTCAAGDTFQLRAMVSTSPNSCRLLAMNTSMTLVRLS